MTAVRLSSIVCSSLLLIVVASSVVVFAANTTTVANATTTTEGNATTTTTGGNATTTTGGNATTTAGNTTTTTTMANATGGNATTTAGNTTTTTTMANATGGNATTTAGNTTTSTTVATPVNVTAFTFTTGLPLLPALRPPEEYMMNLSGSRHEWTSLLNNPETRPKVVNAVTEDMSDKFFVPEEHIHVMEMNIGSLQVIFSVSPSGDGTHIYDSSFLRSASNADSSWLKATSAIWATVSSSKLEITYSGYSNTSKVAPPVYSVCGGGCGIYMFVGAFLLIVVSVLAICAWWRYSKQRDEIEREKLEADDQTGTGVQAEPDSNEAGASDPSNEAGDATPIAADVSHTSSAAEAEPEDTLAQANGHTSRRWWSD